MHQIMKPENGGYHTNRKHLRVNNGDAPRHPVTASSRRMRPALKYLFRNRSISSVNRIKQNETLPCLHLDKKTQKTRCVLNWNIEILLWVTDAIVSLGELSIPLPDGPR